ncbi:gp53-like domain-containing protein [Yersinia ruckeri]|uniref:gp53-like domain-containing protein n=2 Tax=Yersinia ruckeri TaxID=29486 RepID=UPI0005EA9FF3|nr:hypothetical protein [Yersinia ruckeri]AKA37690.1 hypothetical protein UGYR_04310 [Yersinia ruckeri]
MHRIDTPTAQVDKFGAGKNGFTRGNPQTGVPATALDDDYFDSVQEELAGVIEGAGIVLNKANRAQLLVALKKLFLQSGNNLSEIKNAGQAAVAQTLANLGLGDAAKRTVGTGTTQIPDMSSFGSSKGSNGWMKLPSGFIFQWGLTDAGSTTREVTFPIPFPTAVVLVNHFDASWVTQTNGARWGATNRTVTGFTGRTDTAGEGGQYLALGY